MIHGTRQRNDYKALQSLPLSPGVAARKWSKGPYTRRTLSVPIYGYLLMKSLLPWLCVALLLLQGAALAAPPGQGAEQRPRPERPPEPSAPDRHVRPDDARHRDDAHRPSRLSPEERKALRQQIHEATHDLYRPKP